MGYVSQTVEKQADRSDAIYMFGPCWSLLDFSGFKCQQLFNH